MSSFLHPLRDLDPMDTDVVLRYSKLRPKHEKSQLSFITWQVANLAQDQFARKS